jgi:serine/threonine protein kinase
LARTIDQICFCEQYEILRKLGKGSTANVYEVRRKCDHQIFAAKVILKGYLKQKEEERTKALAQEI